MLSVLLPVGLLSTATGGASAAGWLAPQNVSLSVSDLGFDEHGDAIAVGVGAGTGGDAAIRTMTRPLGGQWSASVPVSGSGEADVRAPQVAVNAHGDALVIWSADIGGPTGVVRVSSRPAGGQWSAPTVISEGAVYDRDVDVAIDAQGNATAIWTEFSESASAFVVRSASRPSGGDWSEPVDFSKSSLRSAARLAVDPQGKVTAVWLGDGTLSPAVVRSKSRPAGGEWGSEVALSSDDATASADGPQFALDAQGNATAVWGSHSSGGGYIVQTARRPAAGDWSAASKLGDGRAPQVAVDPQGNATAVWESASTGAFVLSSSRTAAGPWSGPAPMAAGDDVHDVGYPWVAADPQGNVTAIWARYNSTDVVAQATRHVAGSTSWSPSVDLSVGRPITAVPAAGVDPQGHVSMVWSSTEDPWSGSSSVFDPIPPVLGNFGITPAGPFVGQTFGMSVDAFDAWSPVTVSWDFGDGQTANGAAVTHAYSSPGQRTVTVTGVDAAGNTAQTSQTFTINAAAVPPPPKPGPGPRPALKAPVLSGLQQSNARWLLQKAKRGPKLPVGTTFRFRLDRAAQVRFTFSQIVSGRRVNGRCVKATKTNRSKRRCDRAQAAGTLNVAGKAGANSVTFRGKLGGSALRPGRYRLLVTALADGKRSTAKSVQFTIVR